MVQTGNVGIYGSVCLELENGLSDCDETKIRKFCDQFLVRKRRWRWFF